VGRLHGPIAAVDHAGIEGTDVGDARGTVGRMASLAAGTFVEEKGGGFGGRSPVELGHLDLVDGTVLGLQVCQDVAQGVALQLVIHSLGDVRGEPACPDARTDRFGDLQ